MVNNPMFHGSGGWGALQIVGKYDVLDMSDSENIVLAGFQGGVQFELRGRMRSNTAFPRCKHGSSQPATNAAKVAECGDMKTWVVGVNWWMTPLHAPDVQLCPV